MVRAAETLRIVPIVHDGEVLVTVEIKDLDAKEVREVISSGLRTTFTYDIELRDGRARLGGSNGRHVRRSHCPISTTT